MGKQKTVIEQVNKEVTAMVTEQVKYCILTYGRNKMKQPVQRIVKWLIEKPDERVTIVSPEQKPANRVAELLMAVGIESKIIDSTDNLVEQSAFLLTIPSLFERLEDLSLIAEYVFKKYEKDYPVESIVIHPSHLQTWYYLCLNYVSPTGLTTPLLNEEEFIGYLRKALDATLFRKSANELVQYKYSLEETEYTKSAFRPFTLLKSDFVRSRPAVHSEHRSIKVFGIELGPSDFAPVKDAETGETLFYPANIRSVTTAEYKLFLAESGLTKRDLEAQEFIGINSLQSRMIKIGAKCIPSMAEVKVTLIKDIYDFSTESITKLVEMTSYSTKKSVLRFSQDFRSINVNGQIYEATPKQASVLSLLFDNYEAETPAVAQGTIIEEIYSDTTHNSLRKAFGNNALYDLLIESGKRRGTVRFKKFSKIEVVNWKKSLE